ncbi:MAG: cupin domain-containing protein [Solirubrobacterales bacterium]|nr:cupin domain-containing protein [Solirubrobacterales bacterium]MBV9799398.1 cupin domain-containing protein [Solirubrobacterales bacterium]
MRVVNLHGDEWDRTEDREGWRSKDAWVGRRIGAELIGGSVYELEAGDRLWPYHTHHANEEWLIILKGTPTLRTPEGEQTLREGDVVCFPRGKGGAHQVINRTDAAIRVLMLSTLIAPDIVEYLDSGKIGARSVQGERIMLSRPGPMLDYWEGED